MSDCINYIMFSENTLRLEIRFVGDNYHTASVQFKLEARDGRPILDKSVTIPVECLFDMAFLIGMSVRRTAAQYEIEVQEMQDKIIKGQHPFKDIGEEKDVKEDKA